MNLKRPLKPAPKTKTETSPLPQEEPSNSGGEQKGMNGLDRHRQRIELSEIGKLSSQAKAAFFVFNHLACIKQHLNELQVYRLEAAGASDLERSLTQTAWTAIHQLLVIYDKKLELKIFDEDTA